MTENGIIETADGRHAIDINTGSRTFGWVLYRHADGHFVTLRQATSDEIIGAQRVSRSPSAKLRPIHHEPAADPIRMARARMLDLTMPLDAEIVPGSPEAIARIQNKGEQLAQEAECLGVVLTVYQEHTAPRMRAYKTVVETRRYRQEGEA